MPVSESDAHAIIAKCQEGAPFGESNVRLKPDQRTCTLRPTQFHLRSGAFKFALQQTLSRFCKSLAIGRSQYDIELKLRSLLLYQEGSFESRHVSPGTSPEVFGRLEVSLPSMHEGGDLILRHNSEVLNVFTAPSSEFGYYIAAWFVRTFHHM